MEARSQLTPKDLVLDWRAQILHEGNHKIVNKEGISSGERQKGGKEEDREKRKKLQ